MTLNNDGQLSWIDELYRIGQSGVLRENPAEVLERIPRRHHAHEET